MRSETEIFQDLSNLCQSPGYIHAYSAICYRDNVITYNRDAGIVPEDLQHLFVTERLIRSELTTLQGLIMKGAIDLSFPSPETIKNYIIQTDALLRELHNAFLVPYHQKIESLETRKDLLFSGEILREAIFYGAESAYDFQYKALSPQRYSSDREWLIANKGFAIDEAIEIVSFLISLRSIKLSILHPHLKKSTLGDVSYISGFVFSADELSVKFERKKVDAFLKAFSVSPNSNLDFNGVNDYNISYPQPIIALDGNFLLFNCYALYEAMYENPFFWTQKDQAYMENAKKNRGDFTEFFCAERLKSVFSKENVHSNVLLKNPAGEKLGEIDVLVLYGNFAIILQAKSKRLTLPSRKGNDLKIQEDFQQAIQIAYNQGFSCSKLILDKTANLFLSDGSQIEVCNLKNVYVVCAISDHYPSLSFQVREFLKYEETNVILAPFVMDIFTLDVIAEMLSTPLHFISYLNRRIRFIKKVASSHELIILSTHLKRNLWVDDDQDLVLFSDEISVDLDTAMMVRREGIPGEATPSGILTKLKEYTLGRIISSLERNASAASIDLGLLLLTLSEDSFVGLSGYIDRIIELTNNDRLNHDVSFPFPTERSGVTFHCNFSDEHTSTILLRNHCLARKYKQRANSWIGVLLDPTFKTIRKMILINTEWKYDESLETCTSKMFSPSKIKNVHFPNKLPSRNSLCLCESGKKYKRCCGK